MRVSLLFVLLCLFVSSCFGAQVADQLTGDDVCFLMAIKFRYVLNDLWTRATNHLNEHRIGVFTLKNIIDYGNDHKSSSPEFKPLLQLLEEIQSTPTDTIKGPLYINSMESILDAIILSSNWDEVYNQIVPDSIAARIFPLVLKYILPEDDRDLLTNGNYQFSATEENAFHSVKKYQEELKEFFEYLKEELQKIPGESLCYLTDNPDQVKRMLLADQNDTFKELKKLILDARGNLYYDRSFKDFPKKPISKKNNRLIEKVILKGPNAKSLDPFILMVCMDIAAILAHILIFVQKHFY